jgi:hypothetical protein
MYGAKSASGKDIMSRKKKQEAGHIAQLLVFF